MSIPLRSLAKPLAAATLAAGLCAGTPGIADQSAGRAGAATFCGPVVDSRGSAVVGQGTGDEVKSATKRRCPAVSDLRPAPQPPRPAAIIPDLQERQQAEDELGLLETDVGRVSAAVLTGGALFWLLQSSIWTSLLILGLPLWRHVDLLPIVDRAPEEAKAPVAAPPKRDAAEEQAVAAVLDARRPRRSRKSSTS
jgi:hypothetical protein